jgi:hypothetical protein
MNWFVWTALAIALVLGAAWILRSIWRAMLEVFRAGRQG